MNKPLIFIPVLSIAMLLFPFVCTAQDFSWEKGENTGNSYTTYSAINVPAPTNNPNSRSETASWKDADGNLWIFGGDRTLYTTSPHLMNDLSKYDLATRQWTLKNGSAYSSNDFGAYSQQGTASTINIPGARKDAATWTDQAGNLWLFGGYGYVSAGSPSYLNDLWKYNPQTNMWTWMNGSYQTFQLSTQGTQGVPAAANTPGGRYGSVTWIDASGDLWLYGGYGRSIDANLYELCDLWRYNIATNRWTWMGGNTANPFGIYTSQGVTGSLDHPSGRRDAGSWTDKLGNLWLFGGYGWTDQYDGGYKYLNDVWKYNISSGLWTWVKGSDKSDKPPIYGTKGVAATANTPGGRCGFGYANDAAGNFWVFGGRLTDGNALTNVTGDLWKYNPVGNRWTWMAGSAQPYVAGIYGTMGVPDPANSPGAREESTGWCDNSGNVWLFGGFGKDITSTYGFLNDLWKYGNCTAGGYTIKSSNDLLCVGESASLSIVFTGTLSWNTGETTSSIVVSPTTTTTYTATLEDNYGCELLVSRVLNVATCDGIAEQQGNQAQVSLYPNPSNGVVEVMNTAAGDNMLRIYNVTGALVYTQTIAAGKTILSLDLAPGLYYYGVNNQTQSKGKLIIR